MNITLIAALTADGFIARDAQHTSTQWTSKEDAAHFRQVTKQIGVMVMGKTTYQTIGRPLPGRTTVVYSRSAPTELQPDSQHDNLFFTSLEPKLLSQALEKLGHTSFAICGGSSIYRLFMESGLVNRLLLTIEPVLFGNGISLFDAAFSQNQGLELVKVEPLSSQTVVMEYQVSKEQ